MSASRGNHQGASIYEARGTLKDTIARASVRSRRNSASKDADGLDAKNVAKKMGGVALSGMIYLLSLIALGVVLVFFLF